MQQRMVFFRKDPFVPWKLVNLNMGEMSWKSKNFQINRECLLWVNWWNLVEGSDLWSNLSPICDEFFRWINEMKRGTGPTQFYQRVVFWWSDERWEATEWQRAAEDVSVGVLSRGWLPSWQECAWEIEELVTRLFGTGIEQNWHVAVWNPWFFSAGHKHSTRRMSTLIYIYK